MKILKFWIVFMVLTCAMVSSQLHAADTGPIVLGSGELIQGIPGEGELTLDEIESWLSEPGNHTPLEIKLPTGLDAAEANIYIPEDNPMTKAKIELGRQLFFDPRLSSDSTISCASCHAPKFGYGFDSQFGIGVGDQTGNRNSPVAYNRIVSKAQFWDGRADSLEAQAVGPIANPIEMASTHEQSVKFLLNNPGYRMQFERIFEDGVSIDNVGRAIASFERTLVSGPTPYDSYVPLAKFEEVFADDLEYLDELRDEDPEFVQRYESLQEAAAANPMSESAIRGMELFFAKAACSTCHSGANFTDEQYHNLGVGMDAEEPDLGRFVITNDPKDRGAFKTPTLRNIAMTAPYMHDGSQRSLEEVVEWYDIGGHKNPWLSDKMKPLKLTDQEQADLVTFMKEGLAGPMPPVEEGRLPQ